MAWPAAVYKVEQATISLFKDELRRSYAERALLWQPLGCASERPEAAAEQLVNTKRGGRHGAWNDVLVMGHVCVTS